MLARDEAGAGELGEERADRAAPRSGGDGGACAKSIVGTRCDRAAGAIDATPRRAPRVSGRQTRRGAGMSDDAVNRWREGDLNSPVVSVMIGSESAALAAAELLQGFHAPAIRPPTVPANTCRLRVALERRTGWGTCGSWRRRWRIWWGRERRRRRSCNENKRRDGISRAAIADPPHSCTRALTTVSQTPHPTETP